jgi:hypothetical protein
MSLTSNYKTDEKKEVNGVTVTKGKNADGSKIEFILARMSKANKRYMAALERVSAEHKSAIDRGRLKGDEAEEIFMGVFVKTVLLGWNNVVATDVTGEPEKEYKKGDKLVFADFSVANATKLFTRLPDLYDELQEDAKKATLFQDAEQEEKAKN